MNTQDLKGKKVVILGGTSGLGFATARTAAEKEAFVTIASRSQKNIDAALSQLPPTVKGALADVTNQASLEQLFTGELAEIDHLVITAGDTMPTFQPTYQQARQAFEVRFWGIYLAATIGAPHVRATGSITLTNGIVGIRPWKGWSATSAIAGAVESLTRGLALDLAPIRVNAVCPGMIKTPLWAGMSEAEREAMYSEQAAKLPLGRVGEPEDIAQAYIYLMQSGYTTGQILVTDGGAVIS
ncbi:MAG: SDR family oxidoreductase [Edaphobacter sp.]|uniref:SDR family oxidoreductase n=1 Tax=Edaphobacter sp. TaxID=1934404 RepID=UPI0023877B43|nr:SDR family oxidoreductase [Edaphobacter sp.]MDE1177657.1 SDR family oxidoreductase [Edaphobacter sp.]